ncbi:hypothetical protein [Devosia sp. A16]|uniref:hypothetical protein n=1 Tax=Devosia sp. A16 TaxID=1736675 RepID=UPI0006D78807|nr:hypothetical protein [Devosia sp. A16]
MVIISFDTEELKQRCCEYAVAEQAYGAANARALFAAISDAEANETVQDWMDLAGDAITIEKHCSLILSFGSELHASLIPVGTRFEKADDGSVKWQTVQRLKLVHIGGAN